MQTVATAFTAEERNSVRKISSSLNVAWKKQFLSTYRLFTIGVSTIGGQDSIASSDSISSLWNKYKYFDETSYMLDVEYERELSQPTGGLGMGMAGVKLDNTSGRFTPRYSGGNSELFTAVYKPKRPIIINSGFNFNGIDQNIPQFIGLTNKTPEIDIRNKTVGIQATDFIDYLKNKYVDQTAVFTSQRTDQIIASSLSTLGFSTAQYNLDYGINIVPFAEIDAGQKWGEFIHKLVEAENGQFWQDENGTLRFENRQHWDSSPYTNVQRIISTGQVIDAKTPTTDHIINVVEVKSKPRTKQPNQLVWKLSSSIQVPSNGTLDLFINFDDPMLEINSPANLVANTSSDGTGTDISSSISVSKFYPFVRSAKITFSNSNSQDANITSLNIYGRPAKVSTEIYYREKRDSSVTAYEEKPFAIENEYIGNASWAQSYAGMLLRDFSNPENLQDIIIRAIPELQMGDLVSWQGRYWRVYGIKTKLNPNTGFIQELRLLQRTITSYFRIGISSIGGSDLIAP